MTVTSSFAKLYDLHTIESLNWPTHPETVRTKEYLTSLIKNGVDHYVGNIKTDFRLLHIDDLVLPITINEQEYDNSHVCSIYAHYVLFGHEYIDTFHPFFKWSCKPFLHALSRMFKWGRMNKMIIVNNWLFSTCLYPQLDERQVLEIRNLLLKQFPDHVICFHSVNHQENKELYLSLKKSRFEYLASRQVFYFNPEPAEVFSSRIFKSDLKLLKESGYEILENRDIPLDQAAKLLELYNQVYIEKHSKHHPYLNDRFIRLALSDETLQIRALRKEGKIDAMCGFYIRNGVMVSPFLGYDTSQKEKSLYRLISTVLFLESKNRNLLFHLSAGASFYKKIRRGQQRIEFQGIYIKHLPLRRRLLWKILKGTINLVGLQLMKFYS